MHVSLRQFIEKAFFVGRDFIADKLELSKC